ncbi:E1-E2 ATPase-domain-containing protein [Chytriomyces sp. MP71]|nr:E1-E2 ATPase-domain-containing protein [Chytriomyces sp. MP71]
MHTTTAPMTSPRAATVVSTLHLPSSIESPDAMSPRLWAYAQAGDNKQPQLSSIILKNHSGVAASSLSLGLAPGGLERTREAAVLRRAAGEAKVFTADAHMWTVPDHLTILAFNVHCTIQVGTQVYFTGPLPLSQESRKGFGLVICPKECFVFDIPDLEAPSPYPILIQLHKGPTPPHHVISNLQMSPQKQITPVAAPPMASKPRHRRRNSNDSNANSLLSISSTFSSLKKTMIRGLRGNNDASGGARLESRRTLNLGSPFRKHNPAAPGIPIPTTPQSLQQQQSSAPAAEPSYAIPVYHGRTIPARSESIMNLYHLSQDESPHPDDFPATGGIPETLLGQVVLLPQTNGEMKSTFEKCVYLTEGTDPAHAFGFGNLKIGAMKKSDKEVAIVTVQVGKFMDEVYPLIAEIPPIEYSAFLNFQVSSRGGGIWKKYWTVIQYGVMDIFDFEYKEQKPQVSSIPLQHHLIRVSKPDPEEMCAMNCLQLVFSLPFPDEGNEQEESDTSKWRWRNSVVEANGSVDLKSHLLFQTYLSAILICVAFMNAGIEFYQQQKSAAILESFLLRTPYNVKLDECYVICDGQTQQINAKELVLGDIIVIQSGDKIPADVLIIGSTELKVNNSSLTGEADPQKRSKRNSHNNPLEATNLAFNGTLAVIGNGYGIMVRTGDNTVIGQIASLMANKECRESPMTVHQIDCIAAACMAKHQVLWKDLQGVETSGAITLLATDKTGTPTCNQMNDSDATDELIHIATLNPTAKFTTNEGPIATHKVLSDATEASLVCFAASKLPTYNKAQKAFPKVFEIPFKSSNKWAMTIHKKKHNLTFLGLTSLEDPPKHSVHEAVGKARAAGIWIMMVTGDQPLTPEAVGRKINIMLTDTKAEIAKKHGVPKSEVSESEVNAIVIHRDSIDRLVDAQYQTHGHIVGVMGDRVDDSPAVKKADLGIAMNISGSNVSKEVAAMILIDNNFAFTIAGIEEGCLIFQNLKKLIQYTIMYTMPEVFANMFSIIVPSPLPLSSILILVVDLAFELFTALSYAYDEDIACLGVEAGEQEEDPHSVSKWTKFSKLFTKWYWLETFEKTEDKILIDGDMLLYKYNEAGTIQTIGCLVYYFFAMWWHKQIYPTDAVKNSAKWGMDPFVTSRSVTITVEDQTSALAFGQSAFYLALMTQQCFNHFVCKACLRYPISIFMFKNVYSFPGILIGGAFSMVIVYAPCFNVAFLSEWNLMPNIWLIASLFGVFLYAHSFVSIAIKKQLDPV